MVLCAHSWRHGCKCVHPHTPSSTLTHSHEHVHTCMHACTHPPMRIHACMHACTLTCTQTHTATHAPHTHIHRHIYTDTQTQTHTHTHTSTQTLAACLIDGRASDQVWMSRGANRVMQGPMKNSPETSRSLSSNRVDTDLALLGLNIWWLPITYIKQ